MRYVVDCQTCGDRFERKNYSRSQSPPKFCSLRCRGMAKRGVKRPEVAAMCRKRVGVLNPGWKGGKGMNKGYVRFSSGKHRGRYEHSIIMEKILGRPLEKHENIHHKNHNRADNRPENLVLTTRAEHIVRYHPRPKMWRWSKGHDACIACETNGRPHYGLGLCGRCYHRAYRANKLS